jgi:hypothetical protein
LDVSFANNTNPCGSWQVSPVLDVSFANNTNPCGSWQVSPVLDENFASNKSLRELASQSCVECKLLQTTRIPVGAGLPAIASPRSY